jgi:hypothetical protein
MEPKSEDGEVPFAAPFVPPFEAQGKQGKQGKTRQYKAKKSRSEDRPLHSGERSEGAPRPQEPRTGHPRKRETIRAKSKPPRVKPTR